MPPKETPRPTQLDVFQNDVERFREMGRDLKGDRRDFFQSILERMETNCQNFSNLTEEHAALRVRLDDLISRKAEISNPPSLEKEIKKLGQTHTRLKKQVDKLTHQKAEEKARQDELMMILQAYQRGPGSDNPAEIRLGELKNKLQNAEIKNTEAQHLMRAYEKIEYLLMQQEILWKPVLDKQKEDIRRKERDISELRFISRDSEYSNNSAKTEFILEQEKFENAKRKRDAILEQKRGILRQRMAANPRSLTGEISHDRTTVSMPNQPSGYRIKINRQNREKREERYREMLAIVETINDEFGTTEPENIQAKLNEMKDQSKALSKEIDTLNKDCKQLTKQLSKAKVSVEEIEFTSSRGIGGPRIEKEGQAVIKQHRRKIEKRKRMLEVLQEHNKSLIAGSYRLSELLAVACEDGEEVPSHPADVFKWAIDKAQMIKEALQSDSDVLRLANKGVLEEIVRKEQEQISIQEVDSARRKLKGSDRIRVIPRENKDDSSARVIPRNTVKLLSARAVQQKGAKGDLPPLSRM